MRGAAALGIRQILVQGLGALTGIVLARLLSPSDFGLFGIITFVLTFLVAFGDVGLGASLIREPEEPSEEDYRAVFTAQQLLVAVVVLVGWFASPMLAHAYHLPPHRAILFRLVAISLLFTSFQVIPSVRLERHLKFQKLAAVEVAQALVYNGVTMGAAFAGLGPLSFALGLLSRSAAGAAIINWVSPWRIGWHLDIQRIRRHLSFGLPYQGIAFTSLLKDSITPVFVGLALGISQVGYINWANMVAAYPVMALMVLQRVYLPAFARMQAHKERLGAFVEKVILATNAIVAPLAILTFVLIQPITVTVFGQKWLVAIPLFRLFWLANLFVPTATPLMGLLNALGRSRTTFGFALLWMLGTWVMGVPLVLLWGTIGYALASFGVQLTNFLLYRKAQEHVSFRIFPVIAPVWIWASLLGSTIYGLDLVFPFKGIPLLIVHVAFGLIVYMVGLGLLYRSHARRIWLWIRSDAWNLESQ